MWCLVRLLLDGVACCNVARWGAIQYRGGWAAHLRSEQHRIVLQDGHTQEESGAEDGIPQGMH